MPFLGNISSQPGFDASTWLPPSRPTPFTGATSGVTPDFVNQLFIKTDATPKEIYIATGTTAGDIELAASGGGGGGGGGSDVLYGTSSPAGVVSPAADNQLYIEEVWNQTNIGYVIWRGATAGNFFSWTRLVGPTVFDYVDPTTAGFTGYNGAVYYQVTTSYGTPNGLVIWVNDGGSWYSTASLSLS